MSEVRVLVNYDGEWVNSTYVGGQTKGIVISEDIAYQGLVERVYGVVGVDTHEYKLVLKTRYESKFPTQPVEIINDDDLAFFIKENLSRDISSRIPLCTTLERRSFPYGRVESSENSNTAGVGLLKWRMQSQDESLVPLQINCWPSVSGNETYVNTEHDASSMFDLRKCCHFSTSSSSQRGSSCEGDSW